MQARLFDFARVILSIHMGLLSTHFRRCYIVTEHVIIHSLLSEPPSVLWLFVYQPWMNLKEDSRFPISQ